MLMEHQMKISNIAFREEYTAEKDRIKCSENQIKQAVIALLLNANEAVQENGEILMRTSNPDPLHVRLEIIDNGSGISPRDLPHVFEPFFSAKEKVSGIGMGLAIVHGIVQSHNGKVDVQSEPGVGTTLSIVLPLFEPTSKDEV